MKKMLMLLLILALPVPGAAAQENEVKVLPGVAPLDVVAVSAAADYTTAPLAEYYTWQGGEPVGEQAPRMSAEERDRARTLLAAYQAGARPEEDVLDKRENVVVGVYTLKPEEYSGETLFTLLPVTPLTDEQILEVIHAFARSGQTFDPDALSYTNCMRGGGIEATRFLQADERERRSILRDLYIRQGLEAKAVYTPLVSDDGLGLAKLDPDSYCGLDEFLFLPHRQMTDDELLSYLIYSEKADTAEFGQYPAYEKTLRAELTRVAGAPLVLTRQYETMGRMGDSNISYDDEKVYTASFQSADGTDYWGALDVDTWTVLSANVWRPSGLLYSDLHLDPLDGQWVQTAKDAILAARGDGVAIAYAESRGECYLSEAGYGALVNVVMEDGGYYTVQIAYQNESVYTGLFYQSHAPNLERMYPDEMFEK